MDEPSRKPAAVTPIFRWSGACVGFLAAGGLFDPHGHYLGWHETDASVWAADGTPLGQIIDEHYVLRSTRVVPPVRRAPKVPPVPPALPRVPPARVPRVPRTGWVDGLAGIGVAPTRDELIGTWGQDGSVLQLCNDGSFVWSTAGVPQFSGTWQYQGNLITTPDTHPAATSVYCIIEYTGATLTLRRLTKGEHTLLFTLRRVGSSTAGART